MWEDINRIASGFVDPWMVIGDFNNVQNSTDRIGGNLVQGFEFADLEQMMLPIGLFENDTRGPHFTWSNNQMNGAIYSRIDKALCNKSWFLTYPNCDIKVLNNLISDHNPLGVNLQGIHANQPRSKFLNNVVDQEDLS